LLKGQKTTLPRDGDLLKEALSWEWLCKIKPNTQIYIDGN